MTTLQRINLWSSPRNVSTALMYSFAERPDTHVLDEPLYGHYLRHQPTAARHPHAELVMQHQPEDGERVQQQLLTADYGRPVLVAKQMTHHLVAFDYKPLLRLPGVLLIRDPRRILASYHEQVDEVTARDIGLPQQLALAAELRSRGTLAAVLDARRLLLDPAGQLQRLCERLHLEYTPRMLTWQAGPRTYDGVWASDWYANAHRSTGFAPYRARTVELSPKLAAIAEEVQPMYDELLAEAL